MLFHFPNLWCWILWTAKRPNQSILKEISPEYSLEGLMLKLKLQYLATWCEELSHWKRPWFWERLKVGGEGDDRGWEGWMASLTWWTWVWASSGSWWWTGKPDTLQSLGSQSRTRLSNWTITSQLCVELLPDPPPSELHAEKRKPAMRSSLEIFEMRAEHPPHG